MEFTLLYKIFTLSVQGKYTYVVQDCHLWKISTNSEKLASLFPWVKNGEHYLHILVNHTFILCFLSNSYMVIWIPSPLMMFDEKFCFFLLPSFSEPNQWKHG